MHKLTSIESRFGYIEVYTNEDRSTLYAIPHGYVGPALVKKDLKVLEQFDAQARGKWKYILDTSKVKVVNPINPFLLEGLTQFSKMEAYIVYAPSPIVRLMLRLTAWINKPDRVIREESVLQKMLAD